MATQVQFRRGTTGENSSFTGAQGEVTVDITKNTTVVHDGSTLGGFPLLREDGTNMALSSGSLSSCALKFASDVDTGLIRPAENQISIVTGGTAQLTIDSAGAATFNNNVLISGSLTVSGGISGPTYFSAGSAAAPSITFVGDLNTGIYSPGADQVAVTTGGTGRLVVDANGKVVIGNNTASPTFGSLLQVIGTTADTGSLYQAWRNDSGGSSVVLAKSRSNVINTNSVALINDTLGLLRYSGDDGTNFIAAAEIRGQVDGTPGLNDMPGRLQFLTTTAGTSTPIERLRISSTGLHLVNTNAHQGSALAAATPAKLLLGTGTYTDTSTAASGTVALGPITTFDNPSIAATNTGVTYTTASTVYIDGAPTAGTNVTITNPFAFYVNAGQSSFPLGTVTAPSLTFGTDTNTGIWSPAADTIAASTGGSERARIDSFGRLLVGTSSNPPAVESIVPQFVSSSASGSTGAQDIAIYNYQNAGGSGRQRVGPKLLLGKSRSATNGSLGGIVSSGDQVGNIRFAGDDGSVFLTAAEITGEVDGTPGANDMPGRIVFSTTADGASSPTERMRIGSTGAVAIGSTITSGGASGCTLRFANPLTGGTTANSITGTPQVQSDVTATAVVYQSLPTVVDSAFTLTNFQHFVASQGTIGASAIVTNQYGFTANSNITGATNNYGFYGNIASGTGRWNFYANGTAANYFAGNVGIGTTSPGQPLTIAGTNPQIGIPDGAGNTATIGVAQGGAGIGNLTITGIASKNITFNSPSSEFARIDSSGRLLVGTSSARSNYLGGGTAPSLQLEATNFPGSSLSLTRNETSGAGAGLLLGRTRGASNGSNTAVIQDDGLGIVSFQGADGTNFIEGARISAAVDGTPGSTDMPGRLVFSTTADGASTPTERMRISSYGRLYIDTNAHQGNALSDTAPAKILAGAGTYTDTTTAASGSVVHGPINTFDNPAIAATNTAVTYTTASTVYIDGAPTAGTNVTITNPFAFFIGAGQTSVPAGTVGLPSVVFGLNKTTGIYSPATNQVAFSTAGVERLLVDATGNFNFDSNTLYVDGVNNRVGIGASSPVAKFQINAQDGFRFDVGANAYSYMQFGSANTSETTAEIGFERTTGSIYIKRGVTSSPTTALTIDANNRVGIGTSPGGTLDIKAAASTAPLIVQGPSSEFVRIDSSGRLLVGTSTARSNFFGTTLSAVTQTEGTGGAAGRGALSVINNDVSNNPPYVLLGRSGAATLGSNAAVVSGSRLGTLTFHGADGTSFIEAATVAGEVDGTPGTNDMPGRLVFSTTADGASSPTERMRISSYGRLYIDTNAHQGNALSDTAPAKILAGAGTYTDTTTAASGTVVHGPINTFDNPAIAATNTGVIYTTASTVYIDGAPTGGANVTITNPFALYIGSGQSSFPLGNSALPSITFGTNKGTGIWSPAADTIAFSEGGTEAMRIDSSGKLLHGLTSARANFFNTTISPLKQQEGTTDQGRGAAIVSSSATASSGAYLVLAHQKSGTIAGNTAVTTNDELGHISFQGSDATEFVTGASITAEVDGAVAANDMPGRLVFYTTPDGTALQTEKFRITQDGVRAYIQPAPASFAGATTLTNANLFTGIVDYTGALATLTLPLGTTLETAFNTPYVNIAFKWSVINRGSGTVTIGANTNSTVSGSGAVVAGASGRFVTRRTAANTFVTYRLA